MSPQISRRVIPQSNMNKYFANVVLTFTEKIDLATLIKDLELNTPTSTHYNTISLYTISPYE